MDDILSIDEALEKYIEYWIEAYRAKQVSAIRLIENLYLGWRDIRNNIETTPLGLVKDNDYELHPAWTFSEDEYYRLCIAEVIIGGDDYVMIRKGTKE